LEVSGRKATDEMDDAWAARAAGEREREGYEALPRSTKGQSLTSERAKGQGLACEQSNKTTTGL
jgi:hypothetical protein